MPLQETVVSANGYNLKEGVVLEEVRPITISNPHKKGKHYNKEML